MAVCGEEVEPAIEVVVEEKYAEGQQVSAGGTDALGNGFVGEGEGVLFRDVERGHLVGEVTDRDGEAVIALHAGGVDPHRAPDFSVVVEGCSSDFTDLFEGAISLIVKDEVLHRVIRHDEVDPTIAIEVDGCEAERFGEWLAGGFVFNLDASGGGDVGEVAAAIVAVQIWVGPGETHGWAVGATDAG